MIELFRIRAIGTMHDIIKDEDREEETFYIVAAEDEYKALEKFEKIQPEIDPDFEIENYDIELYSTDSVAIVDESLCAV